MQVTTSVEVSCGSSGRESVDLNGPLDALLNWYLVVQRRREEGYFLCTVHSAQESLNVILFKQGHLTADLTLADFPALMRSLLDP